MDKGTEDAEGKKRSDIEVTKNTEKQREKKSTEEREVVSENGVNRTVSSCLNYCILVRAVT